MTGSKQAEKTYLGLTGSSAWERAEAFGMSMVRTLRHAMEDHPIILAPRKPLPDARIPVARQADLDVEAPRHARPGETIAVKVYLINRGTAAWEGPRVAEGVTWLETGGSPVVTRRLTVL